MRFAMKEKIFSFKDTYTIMDSSGNPAYLVKGKFFSWGNNLSMTDAQGREVAQIKQKLLTLKPRYEILRDGNSFAEVVKEWSWFNKKFTLDVPGPNDYSITGSFWEHEFEFARSGQVVASISKKYFSWADTYGIDVVDGEDYISILATCVVIDLVLHEDDD